MDYVNTKITRHTLKVSDSTQCCSWTLYGRRNEEEDPHPRVSESSKCWIWTLFFPIVFNVMKTESLSESDMYSACVLPNSIIHWTLTWMDYRIFNMPMWSFCMCTHGGLTLLSSLIQGLCSVWACVPASTHHMEVFCPFGCTTFQAGRTIINKEGKTLNNLQTMYL